MRLLAALLISLSAVSDSAAQLVHRDSSQGYQFTLPKGWVKMSKEELDAINEGARKVKAAEQVQYDAGFRPQGTRPGMPPFIVIAVKIKDTGGEDYNSLEKDLQQSVSKEVKNIQDANANLVDTLEVGAAVLDRSRNRIILRMTMGFNNILELDALAFGHIGRNGVVFINCYSTKEDFHKNKAVFESVSNTFQYDPGKEFVPRDNSLASRIGMLAGGVFCISLTVATVIWIGRKLFAKSPKQKRRPDYEHDDF